MLAKVTQERRAFFARYGGFKTVRTLKMQKSDPDTGKVKETQRATVVITERFGKSRDLRHTRCVLNNAPAKPEDCAPPRRLGYFHPLFRNAKHYRYRFIGKARLFGQVAYKYAVTPAEDRTDLLKGYVYLHPNEARILGFSGSRADLPHTLVRPGVVHAPRSSSIAQSYAAISPDCRYVHLGGLRRRR